MVASSDGFRVGWKRALEPWVVARSSLILGIPVAAALTPRTRAVMVVHQAGTPADLGPLRGLCAETGVALLMVTHSSRLAARLGRRLHLHAGRLAP